tara:strand:+ start:10202 stop:11827 length:1626 start_codon:yes stop_codon:yes gene_type:complete
MSFRYELIENKAWLLNLSTADYQECDIPKLFHNDILDSDNKLIESTIRKSKSLVGIFSTSQTQRFGKNKRGNIIYLVKPLNNTLPSFLISYGGKLKGKIAIKFKFTNWENKLPSGEIIDVIGNYTDENLNKILMYHHNVFPKNIKLSNSKNPIEETIIRNKINTNIFSIDPDNCQDIDDALSITIKEDETIIGVHIAQPICWLSIDDIYDKLKYQFSTLYMPDVRKDLWGDYVTKQSSLSENEIKPAYTIQFYFKNNKLVKTEDFPSEILNCKVLSYDNAESYDEAVKLKEFTSNLSEIEDYHEVVSYWMLKTNQYIGNKFNNLKKKIPYRVNKDLNLELEENENLNLLEQDKDIRSKFKSKKIESAYYSFEENNHETLKLSNYCHFTSPIRRLIDTWIHYYLTYSINELNFDSTLNCDMINYLDNQTKRFHRDINLNESIKELFIDSNRLEREGYIFEILSNNLIEIYIKDLGFVKVRLYNLKFDYLVKKEKSKTTLKLDYDNKQFIFKVGEKIDLLINKLEEIIPKNKLLITLKNEIIL